MSMLVKRLASSSSWTAQQDARLFELYDKLGPAWHLIKRSFQGKTPQEVRYRWLTRPHPSGSDSEAEVSKPSIVGLYHKYTEHPQAQKLLLDGWEPHGPSTWLRFPIENDAPLSPADPTRTTQHMSRRAKSFCKVPPGSRSSIASGFARLLRQIPLLARKRRPGPLHASTNAWLPIEKLALQQGFDEFGPNWELLSRGMHRRTAGQCRRLLENRALGDPASPVFQRLARITKVHIETSSDGVIRVSFDGESWTRHHQ